VTINSYMFSACVSYSSESNCFVEKSMTILSTHLDVSIRTLLIVRLTYQQICWGFPSSGKGENDENMLMEREVFDDEIMWSEKKTVRWS
jgi:hypothetical protein